MKNIVCNSYGSLSGQRNNFNTEISPVNVYKIIQIVFRKSMILALTDGWREGRHGRLEGEEGGGRVE